MCVPYIYQVLTKLNQSQSHGRVPAKPGKPEKVLNFTIMALKMAALSYTHTDEGFP